MSTASATIIDLSAYRAARRRPAAAHHAAAAAAPMVPPFFAVIMLPAPCLMMWTPLWLAAPTAPDRHTVP
ncbi:hypothetical protein GJ689_05475 [Rhodoplanes serenus]|jgi:hypothetical protein|uniref:Uncharacterized protein n=1 Tax=Rhodoplanes serenus TaxID=200615 RepID=A0A9X4XI94_9BRAD|nr:hypothetical protein [Rhodoplanes serenus]MBI5114304.1 hypothetical protein [Rhodovulum sp.]MTW15655.1 hypothetical protein [Rhodoplanes serenus]